jgi:hypothetical protein
MYKNLMLSSFAGKFELTSGLDSLEHCLNPGHFLDCKKDISYQYNSMGYRDAEWPEDITNTIWCLGDSFTVGLGQPFNEIWPQALQTALAERTINVSMNGASNDWIARQAEFILKNFKPKAILIHWSYFHRREHPDTSKTDEDRIMHYDENDCDDLTNFEKNLTKVLDADVNSCTIHSFVPRANGTDYLKYYKHSRSWEPNLEDISQYTLLEKTNSKFFTTIEQTDRARDFLHYGIDTAKKISDSYISLLNS